MAVARRASSINVYQAARQRIINVFANDLPVYMSFSGGKDSLTMAELVLELIQEGKIDASRLEVHFVDEEAIFPCIERTVMTYRKKFLLAGAQFDWYCVEVKHYSCFNALTNDESFICWDRYKEDVWIRRPPSFAIRSHPLLKPRKDTYQDWLPRAHMDGITITGIRTAESIQRLKNIAVMNNAGRKITNKLQIFPIYDMTDKDVWRYLLERGVDIPEIYLYLWQSGAGKNQLRVSQFFSIDTARSLVKMNEYYPNLMERIIRREPNAYLAALYWDSEMFGRSTRTRRVLETDTEKKDYRADLLHMFNNMEIFFTTPHQMRVATRYRNFTQQVASIATDADYRDIYNSLAPGDPKLRSFRALYAKIYGRYVKQAKKEKEEAQQHGQQDTGTAENAGMD